MFNDGIHTFLFSWQGLLAQFFMHRSSSLATITRRKDYGSTTTNDVTTRKDGRDRRLHLFVHGRSEEHTSELQSR